MMCPNEHPREQERLEKLYNSCILDTEPEEVFDELVEFILDEFNVAIALVSLVDKSRQWFKSVKGLLITETHRDISFCAHGILEQDVFEVQDASVDQRFRDNPLVKNSPYITFYCGSQIISEDGLPLGMLCVIDVQPRKFSEFEKRKLKFYANEVSRMIESKRQKQLLAEYSKEIVAEKRLLEAISQIQSSYIQGDDSYIIFSNFLAELLKLTESEYGFIGEVLIDENSNPFLKTHAITDISWNNETSHWYKENAPDGLIFTNLDTLFGHVIKSGDVLIANDAPNHPLSHGIPSGHPPLNRFLGIPFMQSDGIIGMIGFANRQNDYTEDLVASLKPVVKTCSQLVLSCRERAEKKRTNIRLMKEEEKSKKLAAYFSSIYEFSRDGFIDIDFNTGTVIDCNPAFGVMIGRDVDEVVGMTLDQICSGSGCFEQLLEKIDQLENVSNRLTFEKNINPSGEGGIPVEIDLFWSRDNAQNINSLWLLVRDLREQKEKETKKIQEQKMNSLGTLAGGMAHDFNNILSIISSSAEIGLDLTQDEKLNKSLRTIISATERGGELSNKILCFARTTELKRDALNFRNAVLKGIKLVQSIIPASVKLHVNLNDVGYVMSNQNDISQILLNMLINGVHAIAPSTGNLEVSLSDSLSLDEAILTIKDDGAGMEESVQKKIFDPFFTTKHQKNGTGLGLSTVFAIVDEIGGGIKVNSKIGKGTIFEINLPKTSPPSLSLKKHISHTDCVNKTLNIVVIEDEIKLLNLYKAFFGSRKYNVIGYESAEEALKFLEGSKNEDIDVIISDDEMPGMKGVELVDKACLINPSIVKILITGNVSDEVLRLEAEGKVHKVFQKPISMRALDNFIRKGD